ncbi:hypothetical protein MH117_12985 [Paenibacillus sp. ACRRX]|uniref:hypothetical protein n=1 Tax=Paenibacillus sp. ACRRX TaxID=2918206 RepID=UPI001EF44EF4|nr:hypothetical protein [Paenibacillus sp. ACRRX]MCG7408340.1 hypothetical protein [Paenibacillus sp. ACRRX]
MRIVNTKHDIVTLRCSEVLPSALVLPVKDYFKQLRAEVSEESGSTFSLCHKGYIVQFYHSPETFTHLYKSMPRKEFRKKLALLMIQLSITSKERILGADQRIVI